MKHLRDEELIARCAGGDRSAMDVLVSRYHGKLLDFAFRHLHEREASADVAQLTLVRVFQNAGGYRERASFKTWLYTVALNQVRDEIRKRGRKTEASSIEESGLVLDALPDETEAGQSPELLVMSMACADEVWRRVDKLSENQRTAIILRFRHDLTYEEIARVMDVPSGTAKSLVHHGLKRLRQSMKTANSETK